MNIKVNVFLWYTYLPVLALLIVLQRSIDSIIRSVRISFCAYLHQINVCSPNETFYLFLIINDDHDAKSGMKVGRWVCSWVVCG